MTPEEEALFGQLEEVFAAVDAENVENLQDLENVVLMERLRETDDWLRENHQIIALNPDTQKSRDVHAERAALVVELHRRELM